MIGHVARKRALRLALGAMEEAWSPRPVPADVLATITGALAEPPASSPEGAARGAVEIVAQAVGVARAALPDPPWAKGKVLDAVMALERAKEEIA